jgi:DNA-directed RNA polymerase specialized sigma24 family protein
MPAAQINSVLRYIRRMMAPVPAKASDGQLLERFVRSQDEGAFDALLERHGRMVMGVCRRVLGNSHDAEDAFQATFLVLVHKAGSIARRESVGSWLFGVATRTALRARNKAFLQTEKSLPVPALTKPSGFGTWPPGKELVFSRDMRKAWPSLRTARSLRPPTSVK